MKWQLKFNQPVNNKINRIKNIMKKEDPTEEEKIEVAKWFHKNRLEDFEKAVEEVEKIEKTE